LLFQTISLPEVRARLWACFLSVLPLSWNTFPTNIRHSWIMSRKTFPESVFPVK
jgi:hypothetical protein